MSASAFHTHTYFCDGKDSPRELVEKAILLGSKYIGFSGHSYTDRDENYCMSKANTEKYICELNALKKEYCDKIKIFIGIEQDIISNEPTDRYDYVIGSVHYVDKNGVLLEVDGSAESQKKSVEKYYGGDFLSFVEDYYRLVSEVYEKTKCDIIGHFDLVTKFNEGDALFDTNCERYRNAAFSALDVLLKTPVVFEINYGAISRGYRKTPYPDSFLLDYIRKNGGKTVSTSDCHDKDFLLFGLPDGEDYSVLGFVK